MIHFLRGVFELIVFPQFSLQIPSELTRHMTAIGEIIDSFLDSDKPSESVTKPE
jgi:hypothetical protein